MHFPGCATVVHRRNADWATTPSLCSTLCGAPSPSSSGPWTEEKTPPLEGGSVLQLVRGLLGGLAGGQGTRGVVVEGGSGLGDGLGGEDVIHQDVSVCDSLGVHVILHYPAGTYNCQLCTSNTLCYAFFTIITNSNLALALSHPQH